MSKQKIYSFSEFALDDILIDQSYIENETQTNIKNKMDENDDKNNDKNDDENDDYDRILDINYSDCCIDMEEEDDELIIPEINFLTEQNVHSNEKINQNDSDFGDNEIVLDNENMEFKKSQKNIINNYKEQQHKFWLDKMNRETSMTSHDSLISCKILVNEAYAKNKNVCEKYKNIIDFIFESESDPTLIKRQIVQLGLFSTRHNDKNTRKS